MQAALFPAAFGPTVIRVYAPKEFETLVTPFMRRGCSFNGLPNFEVKRIMQSDPDMREAMAKGEPKQFGKIMLRKTFLQMGNEDAEVALNDMQHSFKPDVIVYNWPAVVYGDTIAQILEIPAVLISMQMLRPSAIEAPWVLDPKTAKRLPSCLIRLTWWLMLRDMYAALPP